MGFFQSKNVNHFLFTVVLCWIVIPFIGCFSSESVSSTPVPDIATSETQMEFGGVVLDNFGDRTLTISNNGGADLSIGQIAGTTAPFGIINDQCSGITLRPNRSCTLQVRFSPSSQVRYNDAFDIPSNDPDESKYTVNVIGDGKALNVSINQVITDDCQNQRIKLFVTLTDKNGDPVSGLAESDLSLFEDGELMQITDVRIVQPPVSTVLALDNSTSIAAAIPQIEAAAQGFVGQMNAGDEASIIKYAEKISVMQGFTSDQSALNDAIDEDFTGDGSATLLYDTVYQEVDKVAARPNERKAVVIISDGKDKGPSTKTLTEAIDRALEKGIPVFTIGLGDVNAEIMQQLADETGGQYYYAPLASNLAAIYLQISDVLAGQYIIEYDSSSSGGGFIMLDLEVDYNDLLGESPKEVPGC